MAKTVKMCDMSKEIAAQVFQMLNCEKVGLRKLYGNVRGIIVTDTEPRNLVYPEGWYYANGSLRNKHTSSTGVYDEVRMEKSNGTGWGDIAKYCTLD